MKKEDYNWF